MHKIYFAHIKTQQSKPTRNHDRASTSAEVKCMVILMRLAMPHQIRKMLKPDVLISALATG